MHTRRRPSNSRHVPDAPRLALAALDALFLAGTTTCLWSALATPALAYVDPSVMTYTIQALAGVAVALSAVLGVVWLRARRWLLRAMHVDENAGKAVEPAAHAVDVNDTEAHTAADAAARKLTEPRKPFAPALSGARVSCLPSSPRSRSPTVCSSWPHSRSCSPAPARCPSPSPTSDCRCSPSSRSQRPPRTGAPLTSFSPSSPRSVSPRCCRRSSSTATSPWRTARPLTGPSTTRSTSRAPSPGSPSLWRSSPSHACAHSPRARHRWLHVSSLSSPSPWPRHARPPIRGRPCPTRRTEEGLTTVSPRAASSCSSSTCSTQSVVHKPQKGPKKQHPGKKA